MNPSAPTLFDRVDGWIVRILKWISFLSAIAIIIIMLVAFFNLLGEKGRSVLGLPISGIPASTEIITYLHIPVVYLAMGYVTLDHGHTRVDLICGRFPKIVQLILFIIGDLMGIGISGFITYLGMQRTVEMFTRNEQSSVGGASFPLWPFGVLMCAGFILLAISLLWDILRKVTGRMPESAPPAEEEG